MALITVIGTGSMGQAIAGLAAKGGHAVQSLGRADVDQPVSGDIVVLAVPASALPEVLAKRAESLVGRTVVDITNPVDMTTFDSLAVPADSSQAALLAQALPHSRVLKAFNTTFASTLVSAMVGRQPTTVLIAGDDARAKEQLAEVVRSAGLMAVDAGSLRRARELESIGFLQITLAVAGRIGWTGGFALVG